MNIFTVLSFFFMISWVWTFHPVSGQYTTSFLGMQYIDQGKSQYYGFTFPEGNYSAGNLTGFTLWVWISATENLQLTIANYPWPLDPGASGCNVQDYGCFEDTFGYCEQPIYSYQPQTALLTYTGFLSTFGAVAPGFGIVCNKAPGCCGAQQCQFDLQVYLSPLLSAPAGQAINQCNQGGNNPGSGGSNPCSNNGLFISWDGKGNCPGPNRQMMASVKINDAP